MKFIQNIFKKFGLKIIRIKSTAPSHISMNNKILPISLSYMMNQNGIVIDIDLDKGRSLPCFSFAKNSNHPFVVASQYADLNEDKIFYILQNFYNIVRPSGALDVFDIIDSNSIANDYPYWSVLMPWNAENQKQWFEKIKEFVLYENTQMGKKIGIEKGWAWLGPTNDEKVRVEAKRLLNVLKSIQVNGYKRDDDGDGDIVGNILLKNKDEWVWQATTGQHRASVVSALNYKTIPVRIMKVIKRKDAQYWPNVQNGLYTIEEGLKIFDMIFDNKFSHLTQDWDEFILTNIKGK
jgi:hypothetical protein